jgi:hypothetical protein
MTGVGRSPASPGVTRPGQPPSPPACSSGRDCRRTREYPWSGRWSAASAARWSPTWNSGRYPMFGVVISTTFRGHFVRGEAATSVTAAAASRVGISHAVALKFGAPSGTPSVLFGQYARPIADPGPGDGHADHPLRDAWQTFRHGGHLGAAAPAEAAADRPRRRHARVACPPGHAAQAPRPARGGLWCTVVEPVRSRDPHRLSGCAGHPLTRRGRRGGCEWSSG